MDNRSQCAYVCDFNERFRQRHETAWHTSLKKRTRRYFSKQYYKQCVQGTFPFVKTLRSYKINKYLANDVIAGLTVGVMQIPQGKAKNQQRKCEITTRSARLRCPIMVINVCKSLRIYHVIRTTRNGHNALRPV